MLDHMHTYPPQHVQSKSKVWAVIVVIIGSLLALYTCLHFFGAKSETTAKNLSEGWFVAKIFVGLALVAWKLPRLMDSNKVIEPKSQIRQIPDPDEDPTPKSIVLASVILFLLIAFAIFASAMVIIDGYKDIHLPHLPH